MMKNRKGLTLIEIILSFALLSLVLITFHTCVMFGLTQHNRQQAQLKADRNLRLSVDLIEKRLREMDRQSIVYKPAQKTFEAVMKVPQHSSPVNVKVDLSGMNKLYGHHTWIYYSRTTGTLRANKAGEHNILSTGISRIEVTELIAGQLFEITLTGEETNQVQTLVFHLPKIPGSGDTP